MVSSLSGCFINVNMYGMTMNNASKTSSVPDNGGFSPASPSLPSLSIGLTYLYNSMDVFNKGVFIKLYRFIWGVLNNNAVRSCGVVSRYWVLSRLLYSSPANLSEFCILSYIYYMSGRGKNYINSSYIYSLRVIPGAEVMTDKRVLYDLKVKGYIIRSYKDPAQPYSQAAQHNKRPVFIKLSTKGLQFVEQMEKDIDKYLRNTSLNDLTGNKKPG